MAFSLQLQQIFPSPIKFCSQPKSPNPQIFPNLTKRLSIHPLASAQNNATSNIDHNYIVTDKSSINEEEVSLPPELRRELMPKHIAVIMDGNRRWAKKRGLPVALGYAAGIRALRNFVKLSYNWGIRALTLFAFSSENWFRPEAEVDLLMGLFDKVLKDEVENLARAGIRLSIIGDSSKLPKSLQDLIDKAVMTTKANSRLHILVAINYSGQYDVVQACQTIAQKVKDGTIEPEDINSFLVEQELLTKCTEFPSPDLLIRTSGELRLSNFLLWQLAYTELFFSHSQWPDFGEAEFLEALSSFQQRQRRYGGQSS
ncbi:dehydrodolichyl diphosphate synthase 2-like [Solanum tuberosum]|uniref:Alkyl transferase n=2 Tax=Solanum tuberosum TaxID=4113 RepID=M1ARR8_SOLTU|nr:PREDICTED: dehydrodolichyl diphosphate synthase 2-like [Solanum tuberosum]